jgi:hypothetical protein
LLGWKKLEEENHLSFITFCLLCLLCLILVNMMHCCDKFDPKCLTRGSGFFYLQAATSGGREGLLPIVLHI